MHADPSPEADLQLGELGFEDPGNQVADVIFRQFGSRSNGSVVRSWYTNVSCGSRRLVRCDRPCLSPEGEKRARFESHQYSAIKQRCSSAAAALGLPLETPQLNGRVRERDSREETYDV